MNEKSATVLVLISGILWGIISIFVRQLTALGVTSLEIAGVRMIVGTMILFPIVATRDRTKLKIRWKDLWMFFGTGVISITLFNACSFTVMQLSEVSIAVVLLYTSPVFVMLMSILFFKEKITIRKLIALAMTLAGCVLVAGLLGGVVHLTLKVLVMGVASGFFYATYSIFGQFALKRYDTMTVTFYTFLLGAICTSLLTDWKKIGGIVINHPVFLAWGVGIGIVCTILPYLLYTAGLNHMEASRAAIMVTVEPLVGSLLGILAYREAANMAKVAGMLLIFASVIVLNTGKKNLTAGT